MRYILCWKKNLGEGNTAGGGRRARPVPIRGERLGLGKVPGEEKMDLYMASNQDPHLRLYTHSNSSWPASAFPQSPKF
jgi:hypothetical protein